MLSERVGKIVDDYILEQVLGTGAFGRVFCGACIATGERVAVKQVRLGSDRVAPEVDGELSIAAELQHPNVARLFEVYRGSRSVYMVMELCTGGELFAQLKLAAGMGLEESVSASYTHQMLSAIGYLHSRRVVHRDLKPENVLLESDRPGALLKIVDFGLSRRFAPGEFMSTRVGTVYYVAPEVLYNQYDELIDVWSVGIISYACICGRPPFTGATDQEVIAGVRRGVVDFSGRCWREVSGQAVELVAALLTFDPEKRPGAWEALELDWVSRLRTDSQTWMCPSTSPLLSSRRRAFFGRPPLERLALTAAAWRLPDQLAGALPASFLAYQSALQGGSGVVGGDGADGASYALVYSSWLASSLDPRLFALPHIASAAFRALDMDGDGKISPEDIARLAVDGASTFQSLDLGESPLGPDGDIDLNGLAAFFRTCGVEPHRSVGHQHDDLGSADDIDRQSWCSDSLSTAASTASHEHIASELAYTSLKDTCGAA